MAFFGGGLVGGATVKLFLDDSQFRSGLAAAEGETRAASGTMGKFGNAAKAGFAVAAAGAVAFAAQSLKAFMESERVMAQFESTLSMMPQLAGETSAAFEEQAHALQDLTGFQDEAIIGADTILARFELTGNQIRDAIPIVLDFARATGRDVPAAAEAIGKALLGNTRALKDVGIEYTRTGDRGADFNAILDLMTAKVGGSAEAFGTTLAGKMDIANAKLDDFKENVGAFLGSQLLLLTGDLDGAASMWVQVADATDEANDALYNIALTAGLDGSKLGELTAAESAARTEMQHTTAAANDQAAAHRNAAAAALQHRTAELSLAGGLVGVQAAASQLHDAQATLNQLEAEGKTGTNAYTQAQSGAYQAFLSLNAAVNDYQSKTRSATGATDQGRGALALMAQSLGIAQGDLAAFLGTTNAALAKQLAFNAALNATPRYIPVEVHTTYTQSGNPTTKGPA